ncbi:YozE family protein [Aerococcus vaginalis]
MTIPFYQFIQRYRNSSKVVDRRAEFAELVYTDGEFPRSETAFDPISRHIEMDDRYIHYVDVFDDVWDIYNQ